MPNWLWQGFLLIFIGIGIEVMHEKLKTKYPGWGAHVLNAVRNVAFLCIIFYVFTGHAVFSKQEMLITPENVEFHIKAWTQNSGYATSSLRDPFAYSSLEVTLSGKKIYIRKITQEDRYLRVQANLSLNPEQESWIKKASPNQANQLLHDLTLQTAQRQLDYYPNGTPLEAWVIYEQVAITEKMTEDGFLNILKRVYFASVIIQEAMDKDLERIKSTPPRPAL